MAATNNGQHLQFPLCTSGSYLRTKQSKCTFSFAKQNQPLKEKLQIRYGCLEDRTCISAFLAQKKLATYDVES